MIGTSHSGGSLFITYSSTTHKIRLGISEYSETRLAAHHGVRFQLTDRSGSDIAGSLTVWSGRNGIEQKVDRQKATGISPGPGTRIVFLQTALRRPLHRLMARTAIA